MLLLTTSAFCIFVTLMPVGLVAGRSDELRDDEDFKTMVIQELKTLNTKLTTLERKLHEKDTENARLKELVNRPAIKRQLGYVPEQEVAFSASVSNHMKNLQAHQPIVFGNVLTNIGHFYNNTTGVFYVPVPGTYLFYVNILSEADNNIESELVVDGNVLAEIYSGSARFNGAGSNLVIAHLNSGQNVWVKVHAGFSTDMSVHCCWSSFTGYLLRESDSPSQIVG